MGIKTCLVGLATEINKTVKLMLRCLRDYEPHRNCFVWLTTAKPFVDEGFCLRLSHW